MKKEVYLKLQGYRECKYCEDYDFILRALQENIKIGRLKEHLQLYRIRSNGITAKYAMEQDRKVEFLRECYKKGEKIQNLSVSDLNTKFSNISEYEIEKYCNDKNAIDRMACCIYEHDMYNAVKILVNGFVHGSYFRKIFIEKFINKLKLNRIYGNKE